ncbi:MAG: hypothetical protein ACRBG0_20205 [Lewinella sp.]|jgi:hypothetical protein|uniref:hypothetical protein n=1 Tax=Lewinella sp. TaxID=2004506 RepID=UPI003D6A0B95
MQKFKVILVVLGLLLVGFVGGFLTNRYLVKEKVRHFRQLERGQNFGDLFLEKIAATEEQQLELRPLLKSYGERFHELNKEHQVERISLTDSLFTTMEPMLTEQQQERSQKWRRFLERGPEKPTRRKKKPNQSKNQGTTQK